MGTEKSDRGRSSLALGCVPDREVGLRPRNQDFPVWAEEVRDFIGVERPPAALGTVLATVLFTDIVDSTQRSSQMGDHDWKDLVQRHHAIVRDSLHRFDGTEVDTAGDGFYAKFEGPARAIRCALVIVESVLELGLERFVRGSIPASAR
jgi:class 3 adenylate cyclase